VIAPMRAGATARTVRVMIIAGDIGATKTRLGLFEDGSTRPIAATTYTTRAAAHPAEPLEAFAALLGVRPRSVSLGVAAVVRDGRARSVKLPWELDAAALARRLAVDDVLLVNDVEANALAIEVLADDDFAEVHAGVRRDGTRAVVAAGTGLGEATLWWDGTTHHAAPSEGGSASFAPRTADEVALHAFLTGERGRVSWGDVCSGPGLRNIYRFLSGGDAPEAAEIGAAETPVARKAVELLVSIYGSRAGDVALSTMAYGGVFLGGGIAPRLLEHFLDGRFVEAFLTKGSLRAALERMPVHVVLNADAAMIGAARFAARPAPPQLRAA
jgi:glucokinase